MPVRVLDAQPKSPAHLNLSDGLGTLYSGGKRRRGRRFDKFYPQGPEPHIPLLRDEWQFHAKCSLTHAWSYSVCDQAYALGVSPPRVASLVREAEVAWRDRKDPRP